MYATQDYKIMKETEEGRIRFYDTEIEKINIRLKRADLDTQNRLILGAQKAEFQREQENARHSLALLESNQQTPEEKARKAQAGVTVRKQNEDRPSKPWTERLSNEITEINLMRKALSEAGPDVDKSALYANLKRAQDVASMKICWTQPRRTDRTGKLLDE